jgi:hypothetical protein
MNIVLTLVLVVFGLLFGVLLLLLMLWMFDSADAAEDVSVITH